MKNIKAFRISFLILTFALVLGAMLAMSITAGAEPTTAPPEIVSQNVFYTDKFQLMFAVTTDSRVSGPVKLYVYEEHPMNVKLKVDPIIEESKKTPSETGLKFDAYIFTITSVGAADMTKEFYVQAEDANGTKSEVKRYSLAEYLYERLAGSGEKEPSAVMKNFYKKTIKFGRDAQLLFDKSGKTLISDLAYVEVKGGTINGFSKGVYPAGKRLTVRADGAITADWSVTPYTESGAGETSSSSHYVTLSKDTTKTVVSLVKAKPYDTNVYTFEDKTPDSALDTEYYPVSGNIDVKYVYELGYGMTLSAVFKNNSDMISVQPVVDTSVSGPDEAAALEISFDIKLLGMEASGSNIYATVCEPKRINAGARTFFANLNGNLNLRTDKSETGGWKYTETGMAFDGEWLHIRLVIPAGGTMYYYYINGSDTPIEQYVAAPGTTYNIANIQRISFLCDGTYCKPGIGLQLDNVLFRYVK